MRVTGLRCNFACHGFYHPVRRSMMFLLHGNLRLPPQSLMKSGHGWNPLCLRRQVQRPELCLKPARTNPDKLAALPVFGLRMCQPTDAHLYVCARSLCKFGWTCTHRPHHIPSPTPTPNKAPRLTLWGTGVFWMGLCGLESRLVHMLRLAHDLG